MISVINVLTSNPDKSYTPDELTEITGRPGSVVCSEICYAKAYGAIVEVSPDRWQVIQSLHMIKRERRNDK